MPLHKFLVVGCGGSGGATLRYMIDQLRADLRDQGVDTLPAAWQFLHIDAPSTADVGPGSLGSITDLGGRYVSVSSPTNTYLQSWNRVAAKLDQRSLPSVTGWAPRNPDRVHVSVTSGAGQYRAIGRVLTLPKLGEVHEQLRKALAALQQPGAWAGLDGADDAPIIPILVSSMAGGAGAGIFLDVARVISMLPQISPDNLGVFLYTADVFNELPEDRRAGIEGNALGAISEIMATIARNDEQSDLDLLRSTGMTVTGVRGGSFGRVFPIGRMVGDSGAVFGDGSMHGIYRGIGRALAAIMMSEKASEEYVNRKLANPVPPPTDQSVTGWGQGLESYHWGSIGYASLSLGRDRYAEYAAQRIARAGADHLVAGHKDPTSQLPDIDQLARIVEAQWGYLLERTALGLPGADVATWFQQMAFPVAEMQRIAAVSSQAVVAMLDQDRGVPRFWLQTVQERARAGRADVARIVQIETYAWSCGWAAKLEQLARAQFVEVAARYGLPTAREVARRLRHHVETLTPTLASAADVPQLPVSLDPSLETRALQQGKSEIGPGHPLAHEARDNLLNSTAAHARRVAAGFAAKVLASFANDVLTALEDAASAALSDLEHARAQPPQTGLAELATDQFQAWPTEAPVAPARFDHAINEVLVTTSRDFPSRFEADAIASVPESVGVYTSARDRIRFEVLCGRWESAGGAVGEVPVLIERARWRASVLAYDPATRTPTPPSRPRYHLETGCAKVLDRARRWLNRPGPYRDFAAESLHSYLNDPNLIDSERSSRRDGFVRTFVEAMELARPLVGVSQVMIDRIHQGTGVKYDYIFSEIGLSAADPTVEQLAHRIRNTSQFDGTAEQIFRQSLSPAGAPTAGGQRISIFGSYQKFSPLVYNSLLGPVQKRWAGATDQYKPQVWQWKRTRPLPASVAMSSAELEAFISGWYLGRLLGMIRQPDSVRSGGAVEVFDSKASLWLTFPRISESTDRVVVESTDWLPAVLGTHGLAMVLSNEDSSLHSLEPYRAVRQLFDDSENQPAQGGPQVLAATERFEQWYASGVWPSGLASNVLPSSLTTPSERKQAVLAWLDEFTGALKGQCLTESSVGLWPRFESVTAALEAPLFMEIVVPTYRALVKLRECAEAARDSEHDDTGKGFSFNV